MELRTSIFGSFKKGGMCPKILPTLKVVSFEIVHHVDICGLC